VVGTVVGVVQSDIKRMLAYSAIAHAGFMLIGIGAYSKAAISALSFYALTYGIATVGAFGIITLVRSHRDGSVGGEDGDLDAFKGLGRRSPWAAGAMTVFLLSFAGVPLTAGFMAKFRLFATGLSGNGTPFVILAVVTCASVLEAAGGLKYMLQVAERILRKNPKRVTILGPIVTYTMTIMLGTGHAVYSIMPIIGDIALKNGIIALLALWVAFNILLYGSIFYGSFTVNWGVDYTLTLKNYQILFGQGFNDGAWPSLINTLIYAGIAAIFTALLGLLIAYIVVRKDFRGKKTLEFLTMLCFAIPGTAAGVSYILAFNDAPLYLTGTGIIVIISMVMRDLPVGMRAAIAGLGQLDKSLDEASLSLKGSSFKTIRYIILPLLKPALLSALVTSFVKAMTTVSAIIFLVTADTRVATAYILNRVEDGEYGTAIAYGSILIVVMMSIILFFDWIIGDTRIARSKARQH